MHAHAHTYLYAHIHTCTCINMHAHTNTCVHTYIYVPYTCVHIPLAGRCREAVTSRTVISRRPPYQHMPFGGPTGSHPKRRCWVQRSGGKVSKMAPSTGWRGQAERRFRPSAAVTVPSACQRAGSPPVGRRSPLRKMSGQGGGGGSGLLAAASSPKSTSSGPPKSPIFKVRALDSHWAS